MNDAKSVEKSMEHPIEVLLEEILAECASIEMRVMAVRQYVKRVKLQLEKK